MFRASYATDNSFPLPDSYSRSRYVGGEQSEFTREWSKSKLRAPYQDNITDVELEEEIPRRLESVNPMAPRSLVHFNYQTGEFVPAPPPSPTIHLLHFESAALLRTSPEILEFDDTFEFNDSTTPSKEPDSHANVSNESIPEEAEEEPDGKEKEASVTTEDDNAGTVRAIYMAARPHRRRKIPNAFNFCEEACQTVAPMTRSVETETIPPPTSRSNFGVGPSAIYDAYAADFAKQEREKRMASVTRSGKEKTDEDKPDEKGDSIKLAERVVCQNIYDEVAFDFRFYEDPADEFRSDGRLLPLWRLFLPGQLIPVTDMEWSSHYYDMLAVTFGAFDYKTVEKTGAVGIFSLKNPLYPEYLRYTDAPALCVSLHPTKPSVVLVGLYNGHVAVFDSASKEAEPEYISTSNSKHITGVYSVKWKGGDALNFYSISADGYVKFWDLMSTRLEATVVRTIVMPVDTKVGPENVKLDVRGSGFRMKFHPVEKNVYLIGTSEGLIMKCSTLQNTEWIFLYRAHHLPVHCMVYSPYNSRLFLSCSADWTVKLWEDERSEPLRAFDLGQPVADVEWAPYTSTVFAAVTSDGRVHIFDLNLSRFHAIHKQHVVSSQQNNEPTRLSFNRVEPVLTVGDKRGRITSIKLSPNLRTPAKASKKDVVDQWELEVRKLEKIVSYMKPKVLEPPPDVPSIPE